MKIFYPRMAKVLPALALTAAVFSPAELTRAQSATDKQQGPRIAQPQQALPPDDPDMHEKTFTGVVVKSGDRVVLLDTLSKTSYQLDDQQKAKSFLNKNVRVTGVLNPATGTIHVSAIDPV